MVTKPRLGRRPLTDEGPMITTQLKLRPSDRRLLEAAAEKQGATWSAVVRSLIDQTLRVTEPGCALEVVNR